MQYSQLFPNYDSWPTWRSFACLASRALTTPWNLFQKLNPGVPSSARSSNPGVLSSHLWTKSDREGSVWDFSSWSIAFKAAWALSSWNALLNRSGFVLYFGPWAEKENNLLNWSSTWQVWKRLKSFGFQEESWTEWNKTRICNLFLSLADVNNFDIRRWRVLTFVII